MCLVWPGGPVAGYTGEISLPWLWATPDITIIQDSAPTNFTKVGIIFIISGICNEVDLQSEEMARLRVKVSQWKIYI